MTRAALPSLLGVLRVKTHEESRRPRLLPSSALSSLDELMDPDPAPGSADPRDFWARSAAALLARPPAYRIIQEP